MSVLPAPLGVPAGLLAVWLGCCAPGCAPEAPSDGDGDGFDLLEDCDDDDPAWHPGAPDFRGDLCDTNCGTEEDMDGDDWPDGQDCDPEDPRAFPCSPHEQEGDGRDDDCDGADGRREDACDGADPAFPDVGPALCGR